jgi:hypothetical protein
MRKVKEYNVRNQVLPLVSNHPEGGASLCQQGHTIKALALRGAPLSAGQTRALKVRVLKRKKT